MATKRESMDGLMDHMSVIIFTSITMFLSTHTLKILPSLSKLAPPPMNEDKISMSLAPLQLKQVIIMEAKSPQWSKMWLRMEDIKMVGWQFKTGILTQPIPQMAMPIPQSEPPSVETYPPMIAMIENWNQPSSFVFTCTLREPLIANLPPKNVKSLSWAIITPGWLFLWNGATIWWQFGWWCLCWWC